MKFRIGHCFLAFAAARLYAGPLPLSQAQSELFNNNLDILTAQTDVKKAEAELGEEKSAWLPSLDASASYSYLSQVSNIQLVLPIQPGKPDTINRAIGFNGNTLLGADLTYPLFTGFARYYGVAGKKETVAEKRASLDAMKNSASLGLGFVYLQWLLAYREAAVERDLIEDLDSYARETAGRRAEGTVLQSAVLEARAQLQFARADLVSASARIDSLRRAVMTLIMSKDRSIVPDSSILSSVDTMQAVTELDTSRPELVAFDHAAAGIQKARDALRFRHFPTLSADLGARYGQPGLNIGIDQFMGWGLVGLSLQWNLFDGLKAHSQDAELLQEIDYIDIARTRFVEDMTRSFEEARDQMATAAERLAACRASLVASLALAEERKNQLADGTATSTDYLNALTDCAKARLQVEEAKTAKRMALLRLRFAAGKEIRY
jgi:outer membrane protein TolC